MMFKKVPLIISLLFFLLGTNVFANSNIETSPPHSLTFSSNQAAAAEVHKTTSTHNQNSFNTYIIPGSITIILLLAFSSYWLIYRRKHT